MNGERILVTGGSGFIGAHCIVRLLEQGYRVRTTVRSAPREDDVRAIVASASASDSASDSGELEFALADLTVDAGWEQALAGCDRVLHVASPFPARMPKDEQELIAPARDGALRVLRAARAAGVRRVVLTSSFAAIGYGHGNIGRAFNEKDWTDPASPRISAYVRSKTIAERAAWEFVDAEGGLELSVVNPVGVLGPLLGREMSTSIQLVERLLSGSVPGIPQLWFGIVDVRDVADLHLRAMTAPEAAGERFLAIAGEPVSMPEIAELLRERLGDAAAKVPTRVLPNWAVRLVSVFDSSVRLIVPDLGRIPRATNHKARSVLGWEPRTNDEAILATAESLISLGLVS